MFWSGNLDSNIPNNSLLEFEKTLELISLIENSEFVVILEFLNVNLSNLLFWFVSKSIYPFVSRSRYISWSLSELRSIELIWFNALLSKLWLLT